MNNQILLGLSIVTVACIYMIYQNFKRDREVNEIKSRVNDMNSIITETVNRMRGEMSNINQKVQVLNQSIQLTESQNINLDGNLTNEQVNQVYDQEDSTNKQQDSDLQFTKESQSINFVENNLGDMKDFVVDELSPIFEQQVGTSREDLNDEYTKFKENKLTEFELEGNLEVDTELNDDQLESLKNNELNNSESNNNETDYLSRVTEPDETVDKVLNETLNNSMVIESLESDNVSEITYDEEDVDEEDMDNDNLDLSLEDINRINELSNIENDDIDDLDLSSIEDSGDDNELNELNELNDENNNQETIQNDFVIQGLDDLQELGELGELGEEELGNSISLNSNTEALDDLEENAKMTTRDELEVMTVKNLKVLARNCGVKSRGNKNDLVDRIYQKISASTN